MHLKKWGLRLVLGALIFAGALACRTSDIFVAQVTVTPTRTPRPTFTPIPKATDTTVPTSTSLPPPPPTIAASATATKRPTLRPATPRPPTPIPQVVAPPPPPPPAAKFQYAANPPTCAHAGNQYIKGRVYDSSDSSANGVSGLMMALGGAGGTDPWVTTRNEDDGFYTFTLAAPGSPAKPAGTYYIWIQDGSGKRISDVGGPININPLGPDAAGTCWAGSVDFWKR